MSEVFAVDGVRDEVDLLAQGSTGFSSNYCSDNDVALWAPNCHSSTGVGVGGACTSNSNCKYVGYCCDSNNKCNKSTNGGYSTIHGVRCKGAVAGSPTMTLTIGATKSGSVGHKAPQKYKFSMTKGKTYTVTLDQSSGDPDLYTHNKSSISTSNWLCRPYHGGTSNETCAFTAPWSGTNYVMERGYHASLYKLKVTSP